MGIPVVSLSSDWLYVGRSSCLWRNKRNPLTTAVLQIFIVIVNISLKFHDPYMTFVWRLATFISDSDACV